MAGSDNRPSNVGTAQRPQITEAMKTYDKASGLSPQYQVVLDVRGDQSLASDQSKIFPIIAALPQSYNINMSSEWESPFANTSATDWAAERTGGLTFKGVNIQQAIKFGSNMLSRATGVSTRLKAQSVKVWSGSSSMRFSLDLLFHAHHNTMTDIRDKHMALLKLCAPSENGPGGQIISQPGPLFTEQAWNEKSRKISLQLGTYLFFDNVVIHSVNSDVDTLCDENGIPIAMKISIEVETFFASFTAQDIERAFNGAAE